MRNFQDTFETSKQQCISAVSICMTVPLMLEKNLGTILRVPSQSAFTCTKLTVEILEQGVKYV